jgi:hypothetical protein
MHRFGQRDTGLHIGEKLPWTRGPTYGATGGGSVFFAEATTVSLPFLLPRGWEVTTTNSIGITDCTFMNNVTYQCVRNNFFTLATHH